MSERATSGATLAPVGGGRKHNGLVWPAVFIEGPLCLASLAGQAGQAGQAELAELASACRRVPYELGERRASPPVAARLAGAVVIVASGPQRVAQQ